MRKQPSDMGRPIFFYIRALKLMMRFSTINYGNLGSVSLFQTQMMSFYMFFLKVWGTPAGPSKSFGHVSTINWY